MIPLANPLPEFGKTGLPVDFYENFYEDYSRAANKALEFNPKILVIGQGTALKEVTSSLHNLDDKIKVVHNVSKLPKSLGPNLKAIVVIESKELRFIVKECKRLINDWSLEDIPIYAIVPDIKGAWSERKLYQTGVQAVFEWPREKYELPVIISKMFGLNASTVPNKNEDSALKLAVRARLLADRNFFNHKSLAIYVKKGIVLVDGVVRSFASLQSLKEKIATMPGVRGVLARSVQIKTHAVDDIKIIKRNDSALYIQKLRDEASEKIIKKFIDDSLKKPLNSSVSAKVFYGQVSLEGTVDTNDSSEMMEDFAINVDGVIDVLNKIEIRPLDGRAA
jgi:osmotically-inducible protein OsmY